MADNFRRELLELLQNDVLYERDILNSILKNAYGGKDFSAVADRLLDRFPGIRAICEADVEEIMSVDGVTESMATYFKLLNQILQKSEERALEIYGSEQFLQIASDSLRCKDNECVEVYYVDKKGKVIDKKSYTSNKYDKVEVPSSVILAGISHSKAAGIYFAHNHVNCSAHPSANDDAVTAKLMHGCKVCGKTFFDHCIISSTSDKFSYLKSGRLESLKSESD